MGEEKKTQLGTPTGRTHRPTGSPPVVHAVGTVPASAAGTPAPVSEEEVQAAVAASKAKTSYLPDAPDPLINATIAERYRVIKKLGEGGMGAVYLAQHMVLEKSVALKVLHGEFARKPDLVERFMQEAKAASRIRHENVIDISDFGATPDGLVFFAMELLKGHDLHEEVARAKVTGTLLPWSRTKKIFLQICSALSAAHARGIIHRDLKPENVFLVEFLGDSDFVKLLDFGIAKVTDMSGAPEEGARKLTKTGMLFGTPEYMSPEQARGDKVDHRVDIYAMGCILFQLVTNRVPFQAENFMGVLSQHLTEEPPQIAPEVFDTIGAPQALAQVIDKALVKDPKDRYQTIDELANAVREVSGDPAPSQTAAIRAANVANSGETTRMRPATGSVDPIRDQSKVEKLPSVPPPAKSVPPEKSGRTKTAWTGNLHVPEVPIEEPRSSQGKSKLPLIVGAVVLIGGGIAAAVVMMGGKKDVAPGPAAVGSAGSGSAALATGSGSATVETPPPPPVVEKLPDMVEIVFETNPKGATVVDLSNNRNYGTTPTSFSLPGSLTPRQFRFDMKGFGSRTVELIPNRARIEFKQELVRGETKTEAVTRVPDPTVKKPDTGTTAGTATPTGTGSATVAKPDTTKPDTGTTAVTKPDTGTGSAAVVTKPDTGAGSAAVKPDTGTGSAAKPDVPKPDDCPEDSDTPCLKAMPKP